MVMKKSLGRMLWAVGTLLALWAAGWLLVPPLLKSQAQSLGSQALGRTLSIGALEFKPWSLELTATDIQVASADGKSTQFSIARVYVDAELQSVLRLAPVIDAVNMERPEVHLAHLGAGRYDIDDLLERFKPDPDAPPSKPLHFALHNLVLSDGSVDFTDQRGAKTQKHSLRKLELAVPFLSNLDAQRDVVVQPKLAFELNGSQFDSEAQGTPFAQTRQGRAQLSIVHLDVAPYLPYWPASLPLRLKSAVLDTTLNVEFVQSPVRTLAVSGQLKLADVRLDDLGGAEWLALKALQVDVKDLRPLEQSVALDAVALEAPRVSVSRNRAGELVWPWTKATGAPVASNDAGSNPPASPDAKQPAGWQFSLAKLALRGGQVRVQDDSVVPAARFVLGDAQIAVRDVLWPVSKPATLEASASLRALHAKDSKAASLSLQGTGTPAEGQAKLTLSDLSLALGAPYLAQTLVPQVQGKLEGTLNARWGSSGVQIEAPRVALRDFALQVPAGSTELKAKDLPTLQMLELTGVAADLSQRTVNVAKLSLQKPGVRVMRDDDGQWMFSHWLKKREGSPATKPAADKSPWRLKLADMALNDGRLTYVDRVPEKTVFLDLTSLQARVRDLTLDGSKPVPVTLSTQVRTVRSESGSVRFDGSLAWDPLLLQGALDVSQFPAQAVAPYALAGLRLDLQRADTRFKGQVRYASLAAGPEVQVRGDAALEELKLNGLFASTEPKATRDANASEELLNWKALSVPGLEFNLTPGLPMRLKVREVSLSDFFARLIINAEGRLVLQDIVKAQEPDPGASAAQAAAPDPVIDVGPIRLINGRVAFSDRFIKPNYSASLTDLSGSLSRFSSQQPASGVQMADLELRGRAEGTASLEITGRVNPLAKPLALDIKGRVRDLELSPLSSYAIKYAGYGIERGKLSVDVNYSVAPDGQLQASNNIVLNQLVFGDAVPGAANSLPVKLAVALLADRNGVIDINLPVSGSLNDPEFRIWPVVWKVVGNLIAKALTSPFTLIGGLLGGDSGPDELRTVAFDMGTTRLTAAGREGLDKVASALMEKPALRLTVVGTASRERETDAIRRERLAGLLLSEKRRVAASAGKDVTAVAAVTADEYPALLKEVYRRSDIKKPRNLVGMTQEVSAADMEARLLESFAVNDDMVRELALNRSVVVREYLTTRQLPSERLFLGATDTAPDQPDWQPRAELNIEQQ